MGGFRFRLERVLDVRGILEEQAKFKWATEASLAHEERAKLASLLDHAEQIKDFGYQQVAIEMRQAMYAYLDVLETRIEQQKERVREQELVAEKAKDEWFLARQETKKVATLREKELDTFIKEEQRKEQKVLDDMRSHVQG